MKYFNRIYTIFNKKVLPKHIRIIAITMILPLLIGGVVVGITMTKVKNRAESSDFLTLKNVQVGIQTQFNAAANEAMKLVTNTKIASARYDMTDERARAKLMQIDIGLGNLVYNEFIQAMYVYMVDEKMVLSSCGRHNEHTFYDIYISKTGESYESWSYRMKEKHSGQYRYGEQILFYEDGVIKPVIEYVQSYPIGRETRGNVVVLLDVEKIVEHYCAAYDDNKALYVLDDGNNIIFSAGNIEKYPLKEKYINMPEGNYAPFFSSNAAVRVNGDDFTFISIENDAVANAGMKSLLITDFILIFFILMVSAILSVVAAYKTSAPLVELKSALDRYDESYGEYGFDINKVNEKILAVFESKKEAERIIEEQKLSVKNGTLKRIIRGKVSNIESDLNNAGIQFNEEYFAVAVVDIQTENEKAENALLFRYALQQMMEVEFEGLCHVECIDDEWNRFETILNFKYNNEIHNSIVKKFTELVDLASLEFMANIEVNIGGVYSGIANICRSYNEANECVRYRLYSGTSRVLSYDRLNNGRGEYLYDAEKENEFIRCVMMGNEKEALRHMSDMVEYHKEAPIMVFQCFFFNLVGTMMKLLNLGNEEMMKDIDRQVRLDELMSCSNIFELQNQSEKIVIEICESVNTYSGNKKKNLRNALLEYLDLHYCDSSLSLEKIAREFNLNFNYVSHFFKDEIGENFVDLLAKRRIEKAKELLLTNATLAEISMKVGYTNTASLIRNFKKITGITPGKFREESNK